MRKVLMTLKLFVSVTITILGIASLVKAQSLGKPLPRVGIIASPRAFASFQPGLRDFGYVDGKTVLIERRYSEGRLDLIPGLVDELVQLKVDIIVAINNVAIRAAKEATKTTPIVMVTSVDPVEAGYVESFASPRGNITGLANLGRDLSAKRVELLKELLPNISRVGILWDRDGPGPMVAFKEYEEATRGFRLELKSMELRGPNPDLATAFRSAKAARVDALIIVGNPLVVRLAPQIFEGASKNRLVSMTEDARYVDAGGLISYGANAADLYRRAAEYVAEILKGAKPSDLPVKLPSKFEVFVNLKTAQQIGVVIPQRILVQADRVIK